MSHTVLFKCPFNLTQPMLDTLVPTRDDISYALTLDGMIGFSTIVIVVLWIYMPGYLANTFAMIWGRLPPKYGYGPWPIDMGKKAWDGKRILGDGKTWNGFIGGSISSGFLAMIIHALSNGNYKVPFIDILAGVSEDAWFWIGNEWTTSFFIGTLLGMVCLFGDATGSFFKRRKGLIREGKETSRAPLLDTLPFAIALFVFGGLFMGNSIIKWGNVDLVYSPYGAPRVVLAGFLLLLTTPFLHRAFNMFGYKMGWKDVDY